jgi:hypothetical protein
VKANLLVFGQKSEESLERRVLKMKTKWNFLKLDRNQNPKIGGTDVMMTTFNINYLFILMSESAKIVTL